MRFALWLTLAVLPLPAAAGTIGSDDRLSISDYAQRHGQDLAAVRGRFGASGRIMCPFGEASAFLVDRGDIVVTARHVLYPEKEMHAYAGRMSINRCGFELTDGEHSTWHKVDVHSFTYPDDKQRSVTDRFDWVVMKLEAPVEGVTPYRLPDAPARVGDRVDLVTIRQDGFPKDGWNERVIAECRVGATEAIDGRPASGLKTDCSSATGSSGGALVRQGPRGLEAIGVHSSVTASCGRFDPRTCFSFDVGVGPDLKAAVATLEARP